MLITHAQIVTPSEIIDDGAVYFDGGLIADVGASIDLVVRYPAAQKVDAGGQLLMPGSICAHTHFYGAYARGMGIPGPPPKDFPQILERLWWPLDKALDKDAVAYSALVFMVDAIKHGTTTLIDHHASPNFIGGSLDAIADAVDQAGLRGVLCYEVTDRDGPEKAEAGIAENIRFLEAAKDRPRLAGTFGLHAALTVSDETLAACMDAAEGYDTGFHIHVAEHEVDEYHSMQHYGLRVVDRLDRAGILGPKSIVAHAVHTDAWEQEILRDTGTWVTHQPRSNMNNAVGAAPIETLMRGGVNLALGTDGFSSNMWAEWKAAYFLHKVASRDPRRGPGDLIAEMALVNNARLAEVFFPGERLGVIEKGAAADLMLVDYHPFTPLSAGNLPWHIVFGFEASMITGTIANGQWLMRDRQLLTLDEKAIAEMAREIAPAVWARYEENVKAIL